MRNTLGLRLATGLFVAAVAVTSMVGAVRPADAACQTPSMCLQAPAPKADLVPTHLVVWRDNVDTNKVVVQAHIKNQGNGVAYAGSTQRFTVNGAIVKEQPQLGHLYPGKTQYVTFVIDLPNVNIATFGAQLDVTNLVSESNEGNNTLSQVMVINPLY